VVRVKVVGYSPHFFPPLLQLIEDFGSFFDFTQRLQIVKDVRPSSDLRALADEDPAHVIPV